MTQTDRLSDPLSDPLSGPRSGPLSNGAAPASRQFDFGGRSAGFQPVLAKTRYSDELGYGWVGTADRRNVLRDACDDPLRRSFVLGRDSSTFRVAVPSGRYRVVLYLGDVKGIRRAARVRVTGVGAPMEIATERQQLGELVFVARSVADRIDFVFENPGSPEEGWALIGLELAPSAPAPEARPEPGAGRTAAAGGTDDLWNLPAETAAGPRALLRAWREDPRGLPEVAPSGRSARDYLSLVAGCVDHFRALQDDSGAIIDPHRGVEFQYATPCFAYAAALIARHAGRPELAGPALAAYRHAAAALGTRTAADGHEDFYPSPLAHAHALLAGLVDPASLAAASEPLRRYDPFTTFRKRPGGTKRSGANWNCKALAGQWLMIAAGLQQDNGYVSKSLMRQGFWFDNEQGLYAEGPATYDAFPRAWLADMLARGYDGTHRDLLAEALERGAISALFMQSPTGELATGGRSSHHQWSDAIQCPTFEWAAGRALAAGDAQLAGIFKRAARRVILALEPWQRESGDFWIVKNRADPAERHGYEVYSSHSQYNLLTATALGFAYELALATEAVDEAVTPAEAGRATLVTGPGIDRAFVTAGGTQVEVATTPVHLQTPRGILRVHMAGLPAQIPLTDGTPDTPMFHLPGTPAPAIALGLAWAEAGGPALSETGLPLRSLAGLAEAELGTEVLRHGRTAQGAFLALRHRLRKGTGPRGLRETIEVGPGSATITWNWAAGFEQPVLLRLPLFAGDGRRDSTLALDEDGAAVTLSWAGAAARFERVGEGAPFVLGTRLWPFRCGWFRVAELPAVRQTLTLRVTGTPVPGATDGDTRR